MHRGEPHRGGACGLYQALVTKGGSAMITTIGQRVLTAVVPPEEADRIFRGLVLPGITALLEPLGA